MSRFKSKLTEDDPDKKAYRVFISYSHEDKMLMARIKARLTSPDVHPVSDEQLASGSGFVDQIKRHIAHAHVFVPIITKASSNRGWVHQEIGYAMAMNIPVLPITVGDFLPPGMINALQAVVLKKRNDLTTKIKADDVRRLVEERDSSDALYACADEAEDRARMMHDYAAALANNGDYGMVRQRAALSSFHIPKETPRHKAWSDRFHPIEASGTFYWRLLRGERIALEEHVRHEGCKLIITPAVTFKSHGKMASIARLKELIAFLESKPHRGKEVALGPVLKQGENITIVGDWFAATSLLGQKEGYRQTIFTRHAPTVRQRRALFDLEFDECKKWPGKHRSTREGAIAYLKGEMAKLSGKRRTKP